MPDTIPQHILIIGAGEFGLATALSLVSKPAYNSTSITILDSSATLPNPSGSSVDANRIVRADYAYKHYARLALEAQEHWRDQSPEGWGGEGRYHEPGFVLTADAHRDEYLKSSLESVRSLAQECNQSWLDPAKVYALTSRDEIRKASGYQDVSGDHGYANFNSGWANAEACVAYALKRLRKEGGDRVTIRSGTKVARLLFSSDQCTGAELADEEQIKADLTILAAGAWSPSLIDLQGRCLATGQTLAFIDITDEEQASMRDRPTVMNMSNGMFIIPPRENLLKIARHGYGYRNLVKIPKRNLQPGLANGEIIPERYEYRDVSVPRVGVSIPQEAQDALRDALKELVPHMADRPYVRTRICWYCDTPSGDFLITHHPQYKSLFLATGGSGNGFKFFPVIGDRIVDAIENKLEPKLAHEWRWRSDEDLQPLYQPEGFTACEDGSRAGRKGMLLDEEMAKQS
ncbi:hypothetical protein LTR10_011678 [Elasticomyces elasticus]|uniref:FAD dependent oxidoreductase domain-containing protein n=1 Tax=Exophiala sideris TaxID=1016849 RepID=A0ABR0JD56_9EURO|nr:hypothetical protein LTR10_011678 [Elasticomyces elasticus]KAK5031863.1 hypothetical protein LTS07_004484 [Exophiala sideris]KAK5040792.1 hypothetical protein LTR13_003093 [Exophiala sideris]KAK5061872.1 hypothetical protein LTR69_005056 [Exophiala sideris]KAK5184572.1 hypothetical protein LTR44_003247 [Eurotiomycetes sp. CCFEE 6388]